MSNSQIAEASVEYLVAGEGVAAGYKMTEVGVIPEEWEIKFGEELTTLIGKGASPRWQGFGYTNSGMLFVTSENVRDGYLDISEPKYLPLAFHEKIKRSKLRKGDILINLVGASIGRSCRIEKDLGEANINQAVSVFRVAEKYNSKYIACYFSSPMCVDRILGMQVDAARPNISLGDLRRFLIPLPSEQEQTAIANALSDVDALINGLEKLITKKQAIKTATMQQLLTGRTRLPQFALREDGTPKGYKPSELGEVPEDWDVFRFDQNFTIYAGGDVPKDSFSNIKTDKCPYPIFANAIQNKGLYGYTGYKRAKPDSVTITARGYLGHAEYRDECFFPIVRLLVLEPLGALDSKYTTYAINERVEFPVESTGVPQLTAPQVGKFSVAAPTDKEEQTTIAKILSDMDEEIQTLQQRLSKTRQIKQGMMQELLTGRTRLV